MISLRGDDHWRESEEENVEIVWTRKKKKMKKSWSATSWNEEIRRSYELVDITAKERTLRWFGHITRRNKEIRR